MVNTYNHLINEDTQCPPVYRGGMALSCDNLRRNVLCVGSKDELASNHPHGPRHIPSVPTNEFVRKLAVQVIVSTSGNYSINESLFLLSIMVATCSILFRVH